MIVLIGILGQSHAGKTHLARAIEAQFDDNEARCRRVAFAEPLKAEVAKLNNITLHDLEGRKEIYRGQLIEVGQARRANDPEHWVKLWRDQVVTLVNSGDVTECIIADDIRFSNEVDAILGIDAGYKDDERIIDKVILVRLYVDESIRRERGCRIFNDPTEQKPSEILNGSRLWNKFSYMTVLVTTSAKRPTGMSYYLASNPGMSPPYGFEATQIKQETASRVLWDEKTPSFIREALINYVRGAVK